jgi:proteasome assembly chaperone (PAC2) family protein
MHVQPTLREAPMVLAFEGWNDAGEAASSAARYVRESICSVPLAELDGEEFLDFTVQRPTVRTDPTLGRVIEWPSLQFHYGSLDSSRELVVGVGVEPHLRWRRFTEAVAELVGKLDIRQVVLLGAYVADVVYSLPVGVSGFSTRPEVLDNLNVDPSPYQGPTGIVGVLADRLGRAGVEVTSLWAGLPNYINVSPNPRGALALVQKLTTHLSIKIDEEPLRSEAASYEQRISELVSSDPELTDYVRELKRREFAQ